MMVLGTGETLGDSYSKMTETIVNTSSDPNFALAMAFVLKFGISRIRYEFAEKMLELYGAEGSDEMIEAFQADIDIGEPEIIDYEQFCKKIFEISKLADKMSSGELSLDEATESMMK